MENIYRNRLDFSYSSGALKVTLCRKNIINAEISKFIDKILKIISKILEIMLILI